MMGRSGLAGRLRVTQQAHLIFKSRKVSFSFICQLFADHFSVIRQSFARYSPVICQPAGAPVLTHVRVADAIAKGNEPASLVAQKVCGVLGRTSIECTSEGAAK